LPKKYGKKASSKVTNPWSEGLFVIKEVWIRSIFWCELAFHAEIPAFCGPEMGGYSVYGDHIPKLSSWRTWYWLAQILPHSLRSDQSLLSNRKNSWNHGVVIYFPDHFSDTSVFDSKEFCLVSALTQRSAFWDFYHWKRLNEKVKNEMKSFGEKGRLGGII